MAEVLRKYYIVVTKYYQFDKETEEGYAVVTPPFDSDGNSCVSGELLPSLGSCMVKLVFPEFTSLPDLIPSALNLLTLSCRAAEVVRPFNLQEGAQFVPARIIHPGGLELGTCECIHFPELIEVLDEERSVFEYSECLGRKIPMSAISPVVKKKCVQGIDLIRALYVGFLCSGELKNAIEEAGLTNFAFEEVPMI